MSIFFEASSGFETYVLGMMQRAYDFLIEQLEVLYSLYTFESQPENS